MPDDVKPADTAPAATTPPAAAPAPEAKAADAPAPALDTAKPADAPAPTAKVEDAKAAEAKPGDGKPADKPADAPADLVLTLPEGVTLEEKHLTAVKEYAKENGLTQAQAQKLLERQVQGLKSFEDAQKTQRDQTLAEWKKLSSEDPEIGGAKHAETVQVINNAYKQYATPELTELLELTGLGNHPEWNRFVYRVARAMAPSTLVLPNDATPAPTPKKDHEYFYPNTK